jgi:uncharacterized NAD-dependent epimerase/dehydratase family protein
VFFVLNLLALSVLIKWPSKQTDALRETTAGTSHSIGKSATTAPLEMRGASPKAGLRPFVPATDELPRFVSNADSTNTPKGEHHKKDCA